EEVAVLVGARTVPQRDGAAVVQQVPAAAVEHAGVLGGRQDGQVVQRTEPAAELGGRPGAVSGAQQVGDRRRVGGARDGCDGEAVEVDPTGVGGVLRDR